MLKLFLNSNHGRPTVLIFEIKKICISWYLLIKKNQTRNFNGFNYINNKKLFIRKIGITNKSEDPNVSIKNKKNVRTEHTHLQESKKVN